MKTFLWFDTFDYFYGAYSYIDNKRDKVHCGILFLAISNSAQKRG